MNEEIRFDYSKARVNRFATVILQKSVVVLLAPDVATVFKSSEAVNEALRPIIKSMPRHNARKKKRIVI